MRQKTRRFQSGPPGRPVPTLVAIAASVLRDFPRATLDEQIDVVQDRASFEKLVPAPTRAATRNALAAAQRNVGEAR